MILFSIISFQNKEYKYSGGGNYGINLIKLLKKNGIQITYLYNSKLNIEEDIFKKLDIENTEKIDILSFSKQELIDLIENKYKVLFSPVRENFFTLELKKAKYIYPVHDLRDLELNYNFSSLKFINSNLKKIKRVIRILLEPFFKKIYLKKIILPKNNQVILTVSKYTKYALKLYFPHIDLNKILVLPPISNFDKLDLDSKIVDDYLKEIGVEREEFYLLTNGNRWEKNIELFIKTYDSLISEHKFYKKVVITGIKNNIFKIKNRKNFIFLDYVSYEKLEILYQNAYMYIYPTKNEGYGLPPIEVMKYSTPVIAAANTAVLEICKDGVEYFCSDSKTELGNKIIKFYYDQNEYKILKEKAMKRFIEYKNENKDLFNRYIDFFKKLGE